jgi:cytochrome c oxidase assembly factor CtaG
LYELYEESIWLLKTTLMFNSMTGMTTHTVPPLASTCTKKNKKHKLTCTLEIHYCKLWWWSIIETEKKTHTHTHEKSRSTDLTYDLFLVFPLSTTFSNKVLETSFLHPKILWFLIATIPRVSFSSSSYFPLSLSLTHNPIPLPRKNAWEKKFARCK